MEYRVEFSLRAEMQLQTIEDYLSERFYPRNAEKFVRRLTQACRNLALAPHRGTLIERKRPGIRLIGFEKRASIYFKVVDSTVYILAILYGGKTPHEIDEIVGENFNI